MSRARNETVSVTSIELWDQLSARAGLELVRTRSELHGYDHAVLAEIAGHFGLPPGSQFRKALERSAVPVEQLLGAVLSSLQPWSAMMADILAMLKEAAARSEGDALRLKLELDKVSPALAETLEAFRAQSVRASQILSTVGGMNYQGLDLWGLRPSAQEGKLWSRIPQPTPMQRWAVQYREWPRDQEGGREPPPPFSTTGFPDLDRELRRLRGVVTSFVGAVRALGSTHRDRMSQLHGGTLDPEWVLGSGWTVAMVANAESDFWPAQICQDFEILIQSSDLPESAEELAEELRSKFQSIQRDGDSEDALEQLSDLFDLPIWQKRHELYSVWVSSIIAAALPQVRTWSLNKNGELSYSFAGSELLWGAAQEHSWALWAELRRPLAAPVSTKRKRAVQPDYTLLRKRDQAGPAALVVECKQYRRQSRRNFRDALTDYGSAHPQAHVLLVNYGPASEALAEDIVRDRPIAAIGDVRPGGAGLDRFRALLRDALNGMYEDMAEEEILRQFHDRNKRERGRAVDAKIVLAWDNDADLDLHVRLVEADATHFVDYTQRGDRREPPWMELDGDELSGPAEEVVKLARLCAGTYEVSVRLFNGEWPEAPEITVRIDGVVRSFSRPEGADHDWAVCRIEVDTALTFRITG